MTTNLILVPISPGDLIDKITTLRLELEGAGTADIATHVQLELARLSEIAAEALPKSEALRNFWNQLYSLNGDLIAIESDIGVCEANSDFGVQYIALTRAARAIADQRVQIKDDINRLLAAQ